MNIKIDILMNIKCKDRIKKNSRELTYILLVAKKAFSKVIPFARNKEWASLKLAFFSQTGLFVWFQIASFCIPFVLRFST